MAQIHRPKMWVETWLLGPPYRMKFTKKRKKKERPETHNQKWPLISELNLTEKGLQIFIRGIWPKTEKRLVSMHWIGLIHQRPETWPKGPLIYALNLTEKGLQIFIRFFGFFNRQNFFHKYEYMIADRSAWSLIC